MPESRMEELRVGSKTAAVASAVCSAAAPQRYRSGSLTTRVAASAPASAGGGKKLELVMRPYRWTVARSIWDCARRVTCSSGDEDPVRCEEVRRVRAKK